MRRSCVKWQAVGWRTIRKPMARVPAVSRGGRDAGADVRGRSRRHLAQYRALTTVLRKRGQLIGCNRLLPAGTATTVRVRKGRVSASDGPFAETKELIGGYFLIEAKDRAEAIRIAARIPGARIGAVEVRPIADDPDTLRALGLVGPSTAD